MANPFYNPTGNPASGSEGLSALMRGEFIAISAGFDALPSFHTTGLYTTTFTQLGNYTFTLPAAPGTLALLDDVAAETTRAEAAEAALAAAVAAGGGGGGGGDDSAAIALEAAARLAADTAEATARATNDNAELIRALFAEAANASLAANAPFRNQVINGQFTINQRGVGPFALATSSLGYLSDRWISENGSPAGSRSFTVVTLADADRTAIGDEEATTALRGTFAGGPGTIDYEVVGTRIENLRRFAGKTVTVSFWAKAAAALTIGVRLQACYGTTGSPSAIALGTPQTAALTTAWQRFAFTFAVPTSIGKTYGSAGDFLELDFGLSGGATYAPQIGVAVQSGTVTLWGVQLEMGAAATPLEKRPMQTELAMCQRFYELGIGTVGGACTPGSSQYTPVTFAVPKRAMPTMSLTTSANSNVASTTVYGNASSGWSVGLTATSTTGTMSINYAFTASAEL